jgi:hypothetical protein
MRNPLNSSYSWKSVRQNAVLLAVVLLLGASTLVSYSSASKVKVAAEPERLVAHAEQNEPPRTRNYGRKRDCSRCAPTGDHELYIPLLDLPEARGGELVFNSRSPKAMEVTPTFYKRDGTPVVGEPVLVQPAEIRYVDIKKLLPPGHRDERGWGGLGLSYHGVPREMWAQYRLLGVNGGANVDEFFIVKAEDRSDVQEAVWWTPPGSASVIALGNITDAPTSATVTVGGKTQSVQLAPRALEVIRHESGREGGRASAVVNITGQPGSIIPAGVIASRDGSFTSAIRFYDTKRVRQSHLFANGLRLAGVTPHLVLKNTSLSAVTARPKFIPLEGGEAAQPVHLPEVVLGPQETVEVDLDGLLLAAGGRQDMDVVSAQVINSGGPGSLIGSIYSLNDRTGVSYETPLRDSGQVRSMTGSYPWKVTNDYSTVVYITNITDQQAGFAGEINYRGGNIFIGPRTLEPGETAVFDLRKIRDEQKADKSGRRLPRAVSLGQFKWAVRGVTGGKLALIGRAEMVSRSQRVSTSYSCNDPCPPSYEGWLDPFPPGVVFVSQTGGSSAWEQMWYDWGGSVGPYAVSASWSLSASIGTLNPTSGTSTVMTGTTPGTAMFEGFIGIYQDYSWDGLNCYENAPYEGGGEGEVEVKCTTPSGETTASGGWADSDSLPTVHKWNQTLTPSTTNFSGRSVTESGNPAGNTDSCHFTGSIVPKAALSGGTWSVGSSNQWGPDYVGHQPAAVTYYRQQGRAPCGYNVAQNMLINCPSGSDILYAQHQQTYDITATQVTCGRNGQSATRTWP